MGKPRIGRKCEICKTRLRSIPFSCCVGCIETLIGDWRKKHPPKPLPVEAPKPRVEVNMKSCDACGLRRDDDRYSQHNCFDVIKQIGRSDFAGEVLAQIANMDDAAALDYIRQRLRAESKAMPDIQALELAHTA